MQHKYFAALAGLLLTASAAQAQVTLGPRVGLNLSTVAVDLKDAGDEFDPESRIGGQVGVALNVPMGKLALQPALLISQKGFTAQEKSTAQYKTSLEQKMRLTYLEVPLNLVFTTGGTEGFQVFAGPYLGVGVGGRYSIKGSWSYNDGFFRDNGTVDESGDVKFASQYPKSNNSDNAYFRTLDAGLNAGLGYKLKAFQVQLGYGLGLGNIIPNDEDGKEPDDKLHNRGFQLTASYFFGGE